MIQWFKTFFSLSKAKPAWAALVQEGAILIDVRTQEEYTSGSVPKAVNVPLAQLVAKCSKYNKQTPLIVFCRSGIRSQQAKRILDQLGYERVYNGGGICTVRKQLKQ